MPNTRDTVTLFEPHTREAVSMCPTFRARVVFVARSVAIRYLGGRHYSDDEDLDRLNRFVEAAPASDPVFDLLAERARPEDGEVLDSDQLRQVLIAVWPGVSATPYDSR